MTDDLKVGGPLPVGDGSSMADDIPEPLTETTTTNAPLSVAAINDHHEAILRPDGQPVKVPVGTMPSTTKATYSPKEVLHEAQAMAKPCTACRHSKWPTPEQFKKLAATLERKQSLVQAWQRPALAALGNNPSEYVICHYFRQIDGPDGRPIHIVGNTCENWKAKRGFRPSDQARRAIDWLLRRRVG